MRTAEEWAAAADQEFTVGQSAGVARLIVAEMFRLAMSEARTAALAEVRSVMGVHLDDVCSSR